MCVLTYYSRNIVVVFWQLANMACVAVAEIFHGWVIPGSFHEHLQTTVHYVHDVLQTAKPPGEAVAGDPIGGPAEAIS